MANHETWWNQSTNNLYNFYAHNVINVLLSVVVSVIPLQTDRRFCQKNSTGPIFL